VGILPVATLFSDRKLECCDYQLANMSAEVFSYLNTILYMIVTHKKLPYYIMS